MQAKEPRCDHQAVQPAAPATFLLSHIAEGRQFLPKLLFLKDQFHLPSQALHWEGKAVFGDLQGPCKL